MSDIGQRPESDDDITFVVGEGNQSSICGAITPMIVVDASETSADAKPTEGRRNSESLS